MMRDLTNAIFEEDIKGDINSYRRNLQVEYVERLIKGAGLDGSSPYDNNAKAVALYELKRVEDMADNSRGNNASKIHKQFIENMIERALDD
jgi:hypothetical protein